MGGFAIEDPGFTLLYVEDEQVTRETVLSLLQRRFPKLALLSAANGAEGMALFREQAPDLVVTDIKMPSMSGIDMAREMMEQKPSLPVIVTSAHSDMNYLIESIELGISRYVLKPIDSSKLFAAVESALATLTQERELLAHQAFVRRLSRALEQSASSIVIANPQGVIDYVNPRFTTLTGYEAGEVLGKNLKSLKGKTELWDRVAAGEEWHGEFEGVKKNGEVFYESTSLSPVYDETGALSDLVAVQEEITERVLSERRIEALNRNLAARAEELELANRDLEGFSYTVSHDLRTPLTNINGYCQVILELYGATLDEQCKDFIKIIFDETVNMNQLIKTLLEFSRVSRSEMTRSEVDLSQLTSLVCASQQLSEPQRRVTFSIAPGMTAIGDPDLLKVVLQNLISNACKYSANREDAAVEVASLDESGELVYFVRDNGAGFDMAQADKLFSPFQRLHTEREFKGFGIGLATVQRIIQRHGGRIWAEGEVGLGACFYFTLPDENTRHGADHCSARQEERKK
ncbi:sensor histidine kinase [Citrifermentans bremense]|uniref:sensor histidine kinase n=1 Tax=Citrifermentans bremense TaxID=60035 RepID=UPI00041AB928|nr:response regulator [Citrifermentans bremense]